MRRELGGAAADVAARVQAGSPGWRDRRNGRRELEGALGSGCAPKAIAGRTRREAAHRLEEWKREGAAAAAAQSRARRTGSPVLDDAREVAARRKRQLGRDRR